MPAVFAHTDPLQSSYGSCMYRKHVGCSGTLHFLRFAKTNTHLSHSVRQSRSNGTGSSHVCRGSGQGSTGQPLPEEEDSDKVQDSTAPLAHDRYSAGDDAVEAGLEADWRAFRARLVAGEQALSNSPKPNDRGEAIVTSTIGTLGKSWAHPIPVPEAGCILVATEKLDGQVIFERTVIFLLCVGHNKPREGPFGLILNRPIVQTIKELEPTNRTFANTFGNCQLFYGGPLEADMFLQMGEGRGENHFEEVIPGIRYGGSTGLQLATDLAKDGIVVPHDFRFYVGYAGWGFDQLMNEIATGLWCVAACSPDLIKKTPTDHLWQEVLLLMGGRYADLSRKPKPDSF